MKGGQVKDPRVLGYHVGVSVMCSTTRPGEAEAGWGLMDCSEKELSVQYGERSPAINIIVRLSGKEMIT